jgi:RHS repeat-associated protein
LLEWGTFGAVLSGVSTSFTKTYTLGGVMVATKTDGVVHYVASDHLGSTSVSHNTSTGSTGTVTYFPFGAERSRTGFVDTERTFTGQVSDGDTGLMFYNARYYDPVAGRFTQADTILVDGPNRYSYVLNNPLNATDPTGRETCKMVTDGEGHREVCWSESEMITGLDGYGNRDDAKRWGKASRPGLNPSDFGLPGWVPSGYVIAIASDPAAVELALAIDSVLTGDLDEFHERWKDAGSEPHLDWSNDNCSDFGVVTGDHFGCIAHDFVYRNSRLLAGTIGADSDFLAQISDVKRAADRRLREEVGSGAEVVGPPGSVFGTVFAFRGHLVEVGVTLFGGSFYKPSTLIDVQDVRDECGSIYGCHSRSVEP